MPAYNREAICQFCNTKIIPPKKGFRSSANGNYICEDCVKLLGQALDVRGKSDGKAKAKKRNKKMTPREIKKELDQRSPRMHFHYILPVPYSFPFLFWITRTLSSR